MGLNEYDVENIIGSTNVSILSKNYSDKFDDSISSDVNKSKTSLHKTAILLIKVAVNM